MRIFRYFLYPFSLLYGLIVFFRNKFYDLGIFKSQTFDISIISVGNLEVGGSGKTPMVEYLIKILSDFKISTLSRGYGRKTKGFRWVLVNDNPIECGDEPLQIKNKFPNISVAVCEDRTYGINKIKPNHNLIVMDDAYQHRAVKPGFSLLLFDFNTLNNLRLLLPAGNYREPFDGRKRADILVVTKCPENLNINQQLDVKKILNPFPHQKVFFSYIKYSNHLKNIFNDEFLMVENLNTDTYVLVLTGIAKSKPLLEKIKKHSTKVLHHAYGDHHQFSQKNMLKLVSDFNLLEAKEKIIITTQKDAVRLKAKGFEDIIGSLPIYEWSIEIVFHDSGESNFNYEILEYAKRN